MAKKTPSPDAAVAPQHGNGKAGHTQPAHPEAQQAPEAPQPPAYVQLPAPLPGLGKTQAQWEEQCRQIGLAHAAAGKKVHIEVTELVASATNFEAFLRSLPALLVAAYRFGLNDAYFGAVHALCAEAQATTQQLPSDLRKIEIVTPSDERDVEAARKLVSSIRHILNRYGNATGSSAELDLLGRGDAIGDSPATVYDALNTFVSQAPQRAALLVDAGIVPETIEAAARARDGLQQLANRTSQRRTHKESAPATVIATKRALDSLLGIGGARIESAINPVLKENEGVAAFKDPNLLGQILSTLPRRSDRRKASAGAGTQPPPADGKTPPVESKTPPADSKAPEAPPANASAPQTSTAPGNEGQA